MLKNQKLEVVKKRVKTPCYCCNEGLYGQARPRKNCKACKGTGWYIEYHYIHIVNGTYAYDGDTIK